ncbi:MAG: hypothetical protein BWY77_00237 [bacterium ADurb.Bin431]|nr:MAG: hypothetical protein BWY77_00237 [bacterium ADurb.Bin431]
MFLTAQIAVEEGDHPPGLLRVVSQEGRSGWGELKASALLPRRDEGMVRAVEGADLGEIAFKGFDGEDALGIIKGVLVQGAIEQLLDVAVALLDEGAVGKNVEIGIAAEQGDAPLLGDMARNASLVGEFEILLPFDVHGIGAAQQSVHLDDERDAAGITLQVQGDQGYLPLGVQGDRGIAVLVQFEKLAGEFAAAFHFEAVLGALRLELIEELVVGGE